MSKKRFYIKFLNFIYIFICFLFRNLISFIQDKTLRANIKNNVDYFSFKTSNTNYLKFINKKSRQIKLKYQDIIILENKEINQLIREILNPNNRNTITNLTGYKYSVDFCTVYKNYHIPKKQSNVSFYANLIHKDKPYSRNMLKIIVPIFVKSCSDGPLSVENRKSQENITKNRKI